MPGILIVEDQDVVREGLRKFIQDINIDFGEVYCASDGEEALRIYVDKKPDLLLVDIIIPKMNGLELIKHVRDLGLQTYIVVISAHADFNFARKAIDYKVERFIVKPVVQEELHEVLITVQKNMSISGAIRSDYEEQLEKYYSMLLRRYLSGEEVVVNVRDIFQNLNTSFHTNQFMIGMIYSENKNFEELSSLKKALDAKLCGKYNFYSLFYTNEKLLYITNITVGEDEAVGSMIGNSVEQLPFGIYAGISSRLEGLQSLRQLFAQSNAALKECLFRGSKLCNYASLGKSSNMVDTRDYFTIFNYFIGGKQAELNRYLGKVLLEITNDSTSFNEMKNNMLNIINYICVELINLNSGIYDLEEINAKLKCANGKSEMKYIVMEIIEDLYNKVHASKNVDNSSYIISYIINYIKNNYHRNISLTVISNELSMNYSYISFLFKKKTDFTFSEYLMRTRLESAKQLLETGNYKIHEIATQCGFYDSKYFCREFKKFFHRTPSQYKTKSIRYPDSS